MVCQRQRKEQVRDHRDKSKGHGGEHPERWCLLHAIDALCRHDAVRL